MLKVLLRSPGSTPRQLRAEEPLNLKLLQVRVIQDRLTQQMQKKLMRATEMRKEKRRHLGRVGAEDA